MRSLRSQNSPRRDRGRWPIRSPAFWLQGRVRGEVLFHRDCRWCVVRPTRGRVRGASSEHPQSRTQDGDQQCDDDNAREYEDEFAVAALSLHPLSVASGVTHYEVLYAENRTAGPIALSPVAWWQGCRRSEPLPTPNLDHPAIAHQRQGMGGGISRHTSRRPRQGARPSEPCPNAFADGRSRASSSFPCTD